MNKFLNTQAILLVLSLGSAGLQSGCSDEKPVRYTGSSKSGAAGSGDIVKGGSNQNDQDEGKDGSDSIVMPTPGGIDPTTGSDPETDPVKDPDPVKPDPVIPKPDPVVPKPDPVVPKPDPVIVPTPMPDGNTELQKKLEAACTPTDIQVVNSSAQAHSVFMSTFTNVKAELIELAKKDCLAMYRDPTEFRSIKKITVTIDDHNGVAYANPGLDRIFFSSKHIMNYANASAKDKKTEIWGVMAHEINHLYQNFWKQSPMNPAFSEGLCDAIRADMDLYPRSRKSKTAATNDPNRKWFGSYTTTGYFLRYLRKAKDPDFYWKFNKAAKNWNDNFWQQNFGMSVDALWNEFQAKGFDPNDY